MKTCINFVIFIVVFSVLKAREFSDEEIRLFLPFIRRWVPPPCPINELYMTCTGKCSDCTQRGKCIVTKCEEGCDCAPRFFRLTPDGPCEPVANCPKPECGENEVFRDCGPISETCRYLESHVINCDHKCYCKEGYLRNTEGVCIPKEECPKRTRCSLFEQWAESGPVDEFCLRTINEDMGNKTQDIPGCYCIEGFKRNLLGRCVNEILCPLIHCLGNEIYHDCIPKCNTTCRNKNDTTCIEDDNCYPGCFCPPGWVMNDFRTCTEINKCSLDLHQIKFLDTAPEDDSAETTVPPTCATTDTTLLADDSTFTNDSAEFGYEENTNEEEENVTMVTVDETLTFSTTESMMALRDSTASEEPSISETTENGTSVIDYTAKENSSFSTTTVNVTFMSDSTVKEKSSTFATDASVTSPKEMSLPSTNTTNVTSVSDSSAIEKPYKWDKVTKIKETKHENAAKLKDTLKYGFVQDEDWFINDDI